MRIKKRKRSAFSLLSIAQSLYMCVSLFFSNDLISSASACAFGFLLSVIPLSMIIGMVLIRILHASPETLASLFSSAGFSDSLAGIEQAFPESFKLITNFEVILSIAVIWMSRRFFSSVIIAMRRIFGKEVKNRTVKNLFLTFSGELLFIIMFSSIIFIMISCKTIVLIPRFYGVLEPLNDIAAMVSRTASGIFPFILLFFISSLTYRFGSRTKPSFVSSLTASAGMCVSFWILIKIFHIFININRYNMIYGVLSNIIVMLMGVFFFFIIFLFFAQWLYVYQFFETLLLCELYLLPDENENSLYSDIKRILFLKTDFLLSKNRHVMILREGEFIYKKNSRSEDAFYIAEGNVILNENGKLDILEPGTFFGEEQCLLKTKRHEDAVSLGNSKIIKIPYSVFKKLIERNPRIGIKALSQISRHIKKPDEF